MSYMQIYVCRPTSRYGLSVRFKSTETNMDNLVDITFPLNGHKLQFTSKTLLTITSVHTGINNKYFSYFNPNLLTNLCFSTFPGSIIPEWSKNQKKNMIDCKTFISKLHPDIMFVDNGHLIYIWIAINFHMTSGLREKVRLTIRLLEVSPLNVNRSVQMFEKYVLVKSYMY